MIVQEDQGPLNDIIFVRHAQSINNQAICRFIQKNQIQYTWANVSKSQEFLKSIKYNPELIDCSITQVGKAQCKQTKIYTDYARPDVVLVSPLERALETCNILYGKKKIPIFVQPILSEGLRSACDVCGSIKEKIERYPQWNFSQTLINDELWYVNHQMPEMKEIILKKLEDCQDASDYRTKALKVLEVMEETKIYQMPISIRQRSKKIKSLLVKYKQKYQTISVVAHYNSINYTIATSFSQTHQPLNSKLMSNAEAYPVSLEQIVKQQ